MNEDKKMSKEALQSLGNSAELSESSSLINETPRLYRHAIRKVYRSFSLSLEEKDYNQLIDYLNTHKITSGSAFIRELLKEKGILK